MNYPTNAAREPKRSTRQPGKKDSPARTSRPKKEPGMRPERKENSPMRPGKEKEKMEE